jgi:transposase-like protein
MSVTMDDSIKRWTAKRKTALVVEVIQSKTTVAEAFRAFDLSPSEIDAWLIHYITERPHLGYRNMGRRPVETVMSFVSQEG